MVSERACRRACRRSRLRGSDTVAEADRPPHGPATVRRVSYAQPSPNSRAGGGNIGQDPGAAAWIRLLRATRGEGTCAHDAVGAELVVPDDLRNAAGGDRDAVALRCRAQFGGRAPWLTGGTVGSRAPHAGEVIPPIGGESGVLPDPGTLWLSTTRAVGERSAAFSRPFELLASHTTVDFPCAPAAIVGSRPAPGNVTNRGVRQ